MSNMVENILPEGWVEKKFGEVCKVINGRAYKKTELLSEGKYKVLRVGNLFTNNSWYWSDLELKEDKYISNGSDDDSHTHIMFLYNEVCRYL